MAYTNSSLVNLVKLSLNHSGTRNHAIDTITIHCMVAQWSIETACAFFSKSSTQASCNYAIGSDGRIALIVEEKNRSWCTSSASNDNRAVTIEVASDTKHPYAVTDQAYASLINLVADICKRNGIKKLLWEGNKNLIGQVSRQNMTVHRWFAAKACPGDYLYNRHGEIARKVNEKLAGSVQVPGNPVNNFGLNYRAHVQSYGTLPVVHDGQAAGTTGLKKRLEGLWIDLRNIRKTYPNAKLSAKAHIQGKGWVYYPNVEHDTLIGTQGESKRLEAFELELSGIPGKNIYYQVHLAKNGWTGEVAGGFATGSTGIQKDIQAIRIYIR